MEKLTSKTKRKTGTRFTPKIDWERTRFTTTAVSNSPIAPKFDNMALTCRWCEHNNTELSEDADRYTFKTLGGAFWLSLQHRHKRDWIEAYEWAVSSTTQLAAAALWAPSGTGRSLLTRRSRCRTGGPQSSPSCRAALEGEQTGGREKTDTKSLRAQLMHYIDNWTHAMRCGALTGSITACLPTRREWEACFYLSLCV